MCFHNVDVLDRNFPRGSLDSLDGLHDHFRKKIAFGSEQLGRHGGLCDASEAIDAQRLGFHGQVFPHVFDGLHKSRLVAGNDVCGVNFVLDQVVSFLR